MPFVEAVMGMDDLDVINNSAANSLRPGPFVFSPRESKLIYVPGNRLDSMGPDYILVSSILATGL